MKSLVVIKGNKMASQAERISIVETKVSHIDEKLDDIKSDVKEMHDCLDKTRDGVNERLDKMLDEYRINRDKFYSHADSLHSEEKGKHKVLLEKIEELEKFKNKWTYTFLGAAAVVGWVTGHIDTIAGILK
jgi:uncharacterized coiled-coil protein SlyX